MKRSLCLMVLLSCVACAPQQFEYKEPTTPPQVHDPRFEPGDGSTLSMRHWESKKQPPRAVIVALHGFNDYSKAFEGPAEYWTTKRIDTYAFDQRGFGFTDRPGIWGNQKNMISDTWQMIRAVKEEHPGVPVYLLGVSMGGAVAVASLSDEAAPEVDGAILVAPALWGGEAFQPFYRFLLWSSAHTMPWYKVTGEGLEIQASDNIEMLMEMGRDPQVIKETRIDSIYGLVHLMDHAYNQAEHYRTPTLILYGARDQVIPEFPIRSFTARTPATNSYVRYPNGWHMLLRDLEAKDIWKDIEHWIFTGETPEEDALDEYFIPESAAK